MTDNVFVQVQQGVPAIEAARRYGLDVKRNRALCPFHADHDPSLSFHNGRFRCWSCGAHGDSIDLTARLLGLDAVGAVRRLNVDFALDIPLDRPPTAAEKAAAASGAHRREVSRQFDAWRERLLCDLLATVRVANTPLNGIETTADLDALTPQQVKAIDLLPWLEYIEELLSHGTEAETLEVFAMRAEVTRICNYLTKRQELSKLA